MTWKNQASDQLFKSVPCYTPNAIVHREHWYTPLTTVHRKQRNEDKLRNKYWRASTMSIPWLYDEKYAELDKENQWKKRRYYGTAVPQ